MSPSVIGSIVQSKRVLAPANCSLVEPMTGASASESAPHARAWTWCPHRRHGRSWRVRRCALDYYVRGRFNLGGEGGYLRKITMSDLALHVEVAAAPATKKTERTSDRNGIGWYSCLGGVASTAIKLW
jgi:hypothetical protein